MNIYFAGAGGFWELFNRLDKKFYFLESFYYYRPNHIEHLLKRSNGMFLDSGAYSAWSKGGIVDINKLIAFIHKNKQIFKIYATLDAIGDPVQTLENTNIMESNGLSPLPVFHYNEDISYLKKMIDKYEYICLGGMVPISTPQLQIWLDELWDRYLTDDDGSPLVKVHGFGQTSMRLLKRYPWYSADSTSWVRPGSYGSILCDLGSYSKVSVTYQSADSDDSYFRMKPYDKERFLKWLDDKGYTIQQLQETYKHRHCFNIEFLYDLCKTLDYSNMKYIQTQLSIF